MLRVQLLNYLQTTTSIFCIQRKHRIHCFPKQFFGFFFFFFNAFPHSFLHLCWCFKLFFPLIQELYQQYISRTLQSLSNFEILLRCSTSPSALALDFVYNLSRYRLIKINLGFTIFIFVRFGFKGRRREWDLVTSASLGMVPSQLCYPLSPQLVCDTRVLTST